MRIEEVELSNFLSHERSLVYFKGNINAIVGPNGAGKTSIIEGISYSLFTDSQKGDRKDLIKKGATKSWIRLKFTQGKSTYEVKRNVTSSAEDLLVQDGKQVIARGRTEVNKKIEEMFGLDKDVLLSTVIVRQGEIEEIFNNLPDVMKKILKIENIEKLTDSRGPIYQMKTKI
ncbi:AAA family ATPase, partial [Acidianus sp. RZ1]